MRSGEGTAHLSGEERVEVDERLTTRHVDTLGVRRAGDLARKPAAEVAPDTFADRARAAKTSRYPCPAWTWSGRGPRPLRP